MNLWHDVRPGRMKPEDFLAVIEIEKGSKNKYELDTDTGALRLDRILYTSTHYPANYGFIPRTCAEDGDPLDVLVLCSEPIRPMSLVRVYPVGCIAALDNDKRDDKILAIPFGDPVYNSYHDLDDLPEHIHQEIQHFFSVYKNLEPDKKMVVEDVQSREDALEVIQKAFDAYLDKFRRRSSYNAAPPPPRFRGRGGVLYGPSIIPGSCPRRRRGRNRPAPSGAGAWGPGRARPGA